MKTDVLVVDDEQDFTFFVKKNLEASGRFEVSVCTDATKAVERARQLRPHVILLDIMMPGIAGEELAVQLQAHQETKHVPVVFLTALVREDEAPTGGSHEIGGHTFVAKPVKIQELMRVLDEATSKRPS